MFDHSRPPVALGAASYVFFLSWKGVVGFIAKQQATVVRFYKKKVFFG